MTMTISVLSLYQILLGVEQQSINFYMFLGFLKPCFHDGKCQCRDKQGCRKTTLFCHSWFRLYGNDFFRFLSITVRIFHEILSAGSTAEGINFSLMCYFKRRAHFA